MRVNARRFNEAAGILHAENALLGVGIAEQAPASFNEAAGNLRKTRKGASNPSKTRFGRFNEAAGNTRGKRASSVSASSSDYPDASMRPRGIPAENWGGP